LQTRCDALAIRFILRQRHRVQDLEGKH
jgi:hypothetical protein